MQWYLVLMKTDPNHTFDVLQNLRKLPENPVPGVNLYNCLNVFGTWDCCIWFKANNHDDAMNFIQKHVRSIPWVTETYAMPTTTIKEYTQ